MLNILLEVIDYLRENLDYLEKILRMTLLLKTDLIIHDFGNLLKPEFLTDAQIECALLKLEKYT